MERNVTPFVINSLRVITFVFRINKGYFLVLYPPLPPYSFHFPSFNSALYLGYLLELHPFLCPRWREEKRKESRTDKQKTTKLRFVFPQVSSSSFRPPFHPRHFVSIAYTRLKWCRDVIFHHRSPSPLFPYYCHPQRLKRCSTLGLRRIANGDESRKTRIIDKEIIIFHGRYVTATSFRALDISRESVRGGGRERERGKKI